MILIRFFVLWVIFSGDCEDLGLIRFQMPNVDVVVCVDAELRDEYFTKKAVRLKLFHFSISPNEMKCENIFFSQM